MGCSTPKSLKKKNLPIENEKGRVLTTEVPMSQGIDFIEVNLIEVNLGKYVAVALIQTFYLFNDKN